MAVGIGPGHREDERGKCWVGNAGKLLDQVLARAGVTDIYLTNLVRCIPRDNDPQADEIEACSVWLDLELAVVEPKVVLLLGLPPAGLKFPGQNMTMGKITGKARASDGRVWIPAPHPAAILRGKPEYMPLLQQAVTRARLEVSR